MANPLDGQTRDEIAQLIKSVSVTFTTKYVKHYTLALVKKIEEDAQETPPPWQLMEREAPTDDIKAGYLTKEGGIRKSWKKRWFIVHHNHVVDYYADEKASQGAKAKAKGTMSLAGYHVVENIGDSLLQQTKDLAEKMGMDVSELPKPKTYPDFTFEVHHSRRRCWFIQAANQQEKDEWVEMFKTCCRNAWGLRNQDPVHVKAFGKAVRDTRWELGRWGWWSWGGSEEQVISDIISDELDWQIMGRIYSKLSGPWMIRNKLRNQVLKTLDTMVGAVVGPAWKTMSATVEEARKKFEPQLKELVDPLGKAKAEVLDKITDAVMGTVNPLLEKHVSPHISKIVAILTSPVSEAYDESFKIFEEAVKKYGENADLKNLSKGFGELDWTGRSWWTMRPATQKLDIMYDPLWLLREIFTDIRPWYLIWNGHDQIRQKMDNAIYTFEEGLKQEVEKNPDSGKDVIESVAGDVLKKYKHDAELHRVLFFSEILKAIVMPPFNEVLIPAVKTILDPLDSAVPETFKDFINIGDMFEQLVNKIVDGVIETVLKS
jgi:hypothetical protein